MRKTSDAQMTDWMQAILNDGEPLVKGYEGIPVVQIIEAVYESAKGDLQEIGFVFQSILPWYVSSVYGSTTNRLDSFLSSVPIGR